jgi:hypothetical protein
MGTGEGTASNHSGPFSSVVDGKTGRGQVTGLPSVAKCRWHQLVLRKALVKSRETLNFTEHGCAALISENVDLWNNLNIWFSVLLAAEEVHLTLRPYLCNFSFLDFAGYGTNCRLFTKQVREVRCCRWIAA